MSDCDACPRGTSGDCARLAKAEERIAALEAKVLYQHAILTHLWDARQHKAYAKGKHHSTTLGTGPCVTRRLQLLAAFPDDRWVQPAAVSRERTANDDLQTLVAMDLVDRYRCNPEQDPEGNTLRALFLYRRTAKGTAMVRRLPITPLGQIEPSTSAETSINQEALQ